MCVFQYHIQLDNTFYLSAVRILHRISKINWHIYVSPNDGYLISTDNMTSLYVFIRHHLLQRPLPDNSQQTSVPWVSFKPTITVDERPQTSNEWSWKVGHCVWHESLAICHWSVTWGWCTLSYVCFGYKTRPHLKNINNTHQHVVTCLKNLKSHAQRTRRFLTASCSHTLQTHDTCDIEMDTKHIQGVPGGMCNTSGECPLC